MQSRTIPAKSNFKFDSKFSISALIFFILISAYAISLSTLANAELVAVSQFGFHPDEWKQVVSYTNLNSGNFDIHYLGNDSIVFSGNLQSARDYNGSIVQCQGNLPCLIGNFTSFNVPGIYYIKTNLSGTSKNFTIGNDSYINSVPTFLEVFNALMQQNSSYHADFHSNYSPSFNLMADGSYIMVADQAALPLIRLGSAYRRNPSLFDVDNYNILSAGKPDMQEYIVSYVRYLEGLQGLSIQQKTDGVGFRLNPDVSIENAFVPGPTNLTKISVYIPGDTHQLLGNLTIKSLCGANNASAEWNKCINDSANFYKCQIDEPCLSMKYIEKTGTVISNNNGYAVSTGWGYEFGCFFDANLTETLFAKQYNPCQIFYSDSNRKFTSMALLAFLEALPAVNDFSANESQPLFNRSLATYKFIKDSYPPFTVSDYDTGFFGAALFLLYDYTGNGTYLGEAYSLRNLISTVLVSDTVRGNEFYWEEYAKHKQNILDSGLPYQVQSNDPENLFRGKIFGDYKDIGPTSISKNGERVFQFDPNIQFQNSRFMLIEGLFAAKAAELIPGIENFIPQVADSQLEWLTGMNAVQQGTALNSSLKSMSFVFGIGDYPNQFHSRYLIDTGYKKQSNGAIIGARGTGFQFKNDNTNNTNYYDFDGKFSILNSTLGAFGNGFNGENKTQRFDLNKKFMNGKSYIPGWINGAFDTNAEPDVIFNYNDDLNAYEYTETTNEIVATAIELLSYQDGKYNNKQKYPNIIFKNESFNLTLPPLTVNNTNITTNISNQSCFSSLVNMTAMCVNGTIISDTFDGCRHILCGSAIGNLSILACDKSNSSIPQYFEMYRQTSTDNQLNICLGNTCINDSGFVRSQDYPICVNLTAQTNSTPSNSTLNNSTLNGTLSILSIPSFMDIFLNNLFRGTTNITGQLLINDLLPDSYNLIASKINYSNFTTSFSLTSGQNLSINFTLAQIINNATNSNGTNSTTTMMVCFNSTQNIPANCTGGTITADTSGGCRTLICTNGLDSLKVQACNKPNSGIPQYFEMYKQSQVGTSVSQICIGPACIKDNGYAKSQLYPICVNITIQVNSTINNSAPNNSTLNGTLSILSVPSFVDIFLNNLFRGTTNSIGQILINDLIPGSYNLLASKINFSNFTTSFSIISSQNLSINFTLTQIVANLTNNTNTTCFSTVKGIPAKCSGGNITQDTSSGCRTIVCTNSSSSMKVLACNKPTDTIPQFFEMYKQSQSGTLVSQICIGNTCVKNNGYAKSGNFSICT